MMFAGRVRHERDFVGDERVVSAGAAEGACGDFAQLAVVSENGPHPAVPPPFPERRGHEIVRWYGREAHPDFDVCADDHCQRYQGITKAFSPAASEAVSATGGEMLLYGGESAMRAFPNAAAE